MTNETTNETTTQSEFDKTIRTLQLQINKAVLAGENLRAKRDIAMLEKLQAIAGENPISLDPTARLNQMRKDRDKLIAVLERKLRRLVSEE